MAKFSVEQAADVAAIQQVINEWGDELDTNSGLRMTDADVLTQDCRYFVGGEWREGLGATAQFYNDRWGLERIDEHGGEMFFRAEGPAHHVLTLHEHPTPGLHHVALEVATSDEIDRAYEELLAAGVEVVTPPGQELEPGIAKSIRFKDPDGFILQVSGRGGNG